jgi:hypothetical protein
VLGGTELGRERCSWLVIADRADTYVAEHFQERERRLLPRKHEQELHGHLRDNRRALVPW